MINRTLMVLMAVLLLFDLQAQPTLGSTSGFALFTGTGAFNGDPGSTVTGDVGTHTGAFTPPGTLIGNSYVANVVSAQAAADVLTAYGSFPGSGSVIGVGLGGQILNPGNYLIGAAANITGVLTLDGQGVYIIDIDGALSVAGSVVLINGASACDVYWRINGALNLGAGSAFVGTAVTSGAINMGFAATLMGRGLSTAGAIGMNTNVVSLGGSQPTASVITAGGSVNLCLGESVTISGNVGGVFNTGESTASITVSVAGDYYVTNTNSCGSVESNHIQVTVDDGEPVASTISGPNSLCEGESIVLTGNTGGTWNTGATTPSITVSTAGEYFVTNAGCGASVESNHIVVTVDRLPIASTIVETGPTTFCAGDMVVLKGNNGGTWSNGFTTQTIVVTESGDYFVTNFNGCGSVESNHIVVTVIPPDEIIHITAGGTTNFCIGGSVVLFGNTNGIWSTGEITPSITVTTSGDYFVTNTDNCGDHESNHIRVRVDNQPIASVITASDTMACIGNDIGISGNVGGVWSTGEGTANIIAYKSGKYFVTNTNSCGSVISNIINIKISGKAPSCVIRGNNLICEGQSTTLCAPDVVGNTYLWSTGETTRCITVNKVGHYTVAVTNGGCVSSCGRRVLPAEPVCVITGNGEIYKGQSTTFCAPVGHSYLWSTGETSRCITVKIGGEYSVTITKNGCSTVCSKTLLVNDKVICIITGDSVICPGAIQTICATDIPGNTYYWNNGQTTRCIEINCEGKYIVTVSNKGLSSICTLVVKNQTRALPCASVNIIHTPTFRTGNGLEINNYPNPFTNQSVIDFKDTKDGHAVIELFNLSGQKILTLFDGDIKKGLLYRVRIDGSKLGEGTYLYRIKTNDNTVVKKLIRQ